MRTFRTFAAAVLLLGAAAMTSTPAADAAIGTPVPAPLRLTLPGARYRVSATAPDLAGDNPLADPVFQATEPLGPLYAAGRPEPAAEATTIRAVRCGTTLYLAVELRSAQPPKPYTGEELSDLWRGDAFEIFLAGAQDTPFTQLTIAADGRLAATRFGAVGQGVDPTAAEGLAVTAAGLKLRTGTGPGGQGWWLVLALQGNSLAPALDHLRANFLRDNANGTGYSWCDLDGGSAHQPDRFGRLDPLPGVAGDGGAGGAAAADGTPPAVQLPAALAIGRNRLTVVNPAAGYVLVAGATRVALDAAQVELPVAESGRLALRLERADGTLVRQYVACVRRAFFIEAVKPFSTELDGPVDLRLALNVAVDQPVKVQLEATQAGKRVGAVTVDTGAGLQTVSVPIAGTQAGEITLRAQVEVPLSGDRTLALTADSLCVRGKTADDLNVFRAGLDALDLRQRYRAMVADAAGIFRMIQGGDGRVRSISRRGDLGFTEWNYGAAYLFAVAYTADWPENPHKGDKRFLTAAKHALEAGLDPEAQMPAGGHSRPLRPLTLTYDLIQKDLDPAVRAHLRAQLTDLVEEVVRTRLVPASRRYSMYSEDVGTGTNHFAYYCTGVLAAGRVLNRPEWTALATEFLMRLSDHGRDGQFPERPGVSASHYTWLTMHALGQFYEDTQDAALLPTLQHCADYAVHTSLPVQAPFLLHDGRNNTYGGGDAGMFVVSLTPAGRALVRAQQREHSGENRRPTQSGPEYWYRTCDDAMYCQTGPEAPLEEPAEMTFLGGRALLARRSGFAYGLSAIPLAPTTRKYWLDPQNALEVHSLSLGPILCGANSQQQPEAGSFLRTRDGRTEFLPTEGTLAKLTDGHAALLEFPSFEARVAVTVADARHARVSVQVLSRTGPEPVTFSFFPGVRRAEDLKVAADGKTLQFGSVTLQCSAAPTIERNFKLLDPYTLKRTLDTKPVRAHVDLTDAAAFTIEIESEK